MYTPQVELPPDITTRNSRTSSHNRISPENVPVLLRIQQLAPRMRCRMELPMELVKSALHPNRILNETTYSLLKNQPPILRQLH